MLLIAEPVTVVVHVCSIQECASLYTMHYTYMCTKVSKHTFIEYLRLVHKSFQAPKRLGNSESVVGIIINHTESEKLISKYLSATSDSTNQRSIPVCVNC